MAVARAIRHLELWTDLACAGGERLGLFTDIKRLEIQYDVSSVDDALTFTTTRTIAIFTSLRHRRVVRVVFEDDDWEEWRITNIREGADYLVTVKARSILLDLGAVILSTEDLGTLPITFDEVVVEETPTSIITNYVLPDLALRGMSYWAVGTVESTLVMSTSWSNSTALQLCRSLVDEIIAQGGRAELRARRVSTTGYEIDILEEIGAGSDTPVVTVQKNLIDTVIDQDATDLASRFCALGSIGDMWASAMKVVAVDSGTSRVKLQFGTNSAWVADRDDEYNGLRFMLLPNGVCYEVIDTIAATNEIELASVSGIRVGDWMAPRSTGGVTRAVRRTHALRWFGYITSVDAGNKRLSIRSPWTTDTAGRTNNNKRIIAEAGDALGYRAQRYELVIHTNITYVDAGTQTVTVASATGIAIGDIVAVNSGLGVTTPSWGTTYPDDNSMWARVNSVSGTTIGLETIDTGEPWVLITSGAALSGHFYRISATPATFVTAVDATVSANKVDVAVVTGFAATDLVELNRVDYPGRGWLEDAELVGLYGPVERVLVNSNFHGVMNWQGDGSSEDWNTTKRTMLSPANHGPTITASGVTGFVASRLNDISTSVAVFTNPTSGAWVKWDVGAGGVANAVAQQFWPCEHSRFDVYMDGATSTAQWSIQYSDDGSSWTSVLTGQVFSSAGWQSVTWTPAGAHRYWRITCTNSPPGGESSPTEMIWYAEVGNPREYGLQGTPYARWRSKSVFEEATQTANDQRQYIYNFPYMERLSAIDTAYIRTADLGIPSGGGLRLFVGGFNNAAVYESPIITVPEAAGDVYTIRMRYVIRGGGGTGGKVFFRILDGMLGTTLLSETIMDHTFPILKDDDVEYEFEWSNLSYEAAWRSGIRLSVEVQGSVAQPSLFGVDLLRVNVLLGSLAVPEDTYVNRGSGDRLWQAMRRYRDSLGAGAITFDIDAMDMEFINGSDAAPVGSSLRLIDDRVSADQVLRILQKRITFISGEETTGTRTKFVLASAPRKLTKLIQLRGV